MADRGGLKLVGFIFATVTVAVMLTATMRRHGYTRCREKDQRDGQS